MSHFRRPGRDLLRKPWASIIPVSLGLSITSLVLFSWLADQILRKGTDQFDETARSLIHHFSSPAFTAVMRFVTNLGDWQVILTGTLGLCLYLWYRHDRAHLVVVLVSMAGAGILDGVLKLVFHRPRPDPFFVAKPSTYSFPSGHALISLCFYALVAGTFSSGLREKWQRVLVWSAAAIMIAMIGLSRVYLGVHWPSDVLAGFAAALIWMGAVRALALHLEERRTKPA